MCPNMHIYTPTLICCLRWELTKDVIENVAKSAATYIWSAKSYPGKNPFFFLDEFFSGTRIRKNF